ncbi:hypothetical protein C8R43DRAFT_179640 [Mycena crocata]|nr:hypothetical protein C8R43DRAFT_179640 [Mycena crocata]
MARYATPHLERFELFDRATSDEREWYEPVSTLLRCLFPPEHYEVAPEYKGPIYPGSPDFSTLFVVRLVRQNTKHPICFVEIKPAVHLDQLGTRSVADREMRKRVEYFVDDLAIPTLIGLSLIGSRFAVYEYDQASRQLTPPRIDRNPRTLNDTAPATLGTRLSGHWRWPSEAPTSCTISSDALRCFSQPHFPSFSKIIDSGTDLIAMTYSPRIRYSTC